MASTDTQEATTSAARAGTRPRVYLIGLGLYISVLTVLMFLRGGFVEPDTFLLSLLVAAIILGQARTFLRDWIPFVVVLFGWQVMRGLADNASQSAGFTLHNADLIAAERWLFNGSIPTVVLQRWLYTPGVVRWYDVGATAIWAFHFVLPLLFAFLLWLRNRALYWRFAYGLMTLSFAAFFTYIVFPAVPPWLASYWGTIPDPIYLIREQVLRQVQSGVDIASVVQMANPNAVAAMPSLHAAYPTLILLFTLFHWRQAAPVMVAYCLWLWFSVVYIGDHYVIDVLAGITYAVVSFFAVEGVYRWRARRVRARTSAQPEVTVT